MRAICTNNSKHSRFCTVAHVAQTWEVDSSGEFVDVVTDCDEVVARPRPYNSWQCMECGAEAEVTP